MIVIPKIRLATALDAQAIADMSRRHVEHNLGWSWTGPRVQTAIANPSTNVVVVHEHGVLVGFGIMHYGDLSAHLALLAVAPERRRRGLGTGLMHWLEKCAHTAGIELINLEARADNPGAIDFYQKIGYVKLDRVTGYYRGTLDAVRLQKRLWDPGDASLS